MKKFLLLTLLISVLAGCQSKDFQVTSKENKREILEKIYIKKDARAKEKYKKILAELERASAEGSDEARIELKLWQEAKINFAGEKLKEKGIEMQEALIETGEELQKSVKEFMDKQEW